MSYDPQLVGYDVHRTMQPGSNQEQVRVSVTVPRHRNGAQAASLLLSELGNNSEVSSGVRRLEKQVFAAVVLVFVSAYLKRWASQ